MLRKSGKTWLFVLFLLCFSGMASAQELTDDKPWFWGDISRFTELTCFRFADDNVIGDESSIFKGSDSNESLMGCKPDTDLYPEDATEEDMGGIYKGESSADPAISCTALMSLCIADVGENCDQSLHKGGSSFDMLVSCSDPMLLELEDTRIGIYKGTASNDYFVDCLEKPVLIDVDLPMYQGSRSYEEIVDCNGYQLGKGTSFVGGDSRSTAVYCNEIVMGDGTGTSRGDSSHYMMTATACFVTLESLTGESSFAGGVSRNAFVYCIDDVPLGEPAGGYYRGGESAEDGGIFCYTPPCLNLQPAVITTTSGIPMCVGAGKNIVLTASPADSRKWQRYNTLTIKWDDLSTDPQIIIGSELAGDYRLISFGSSAGCADTSAVFYAEFVTNIPQPIVTVEGSNVICAGGKTALRSSEAHEYLWSNGATTQTIWVTEGGEYAVTITDINGCSATSDPVTMIDGTMAAPVSTIIPSGKIELCAGASQTLTANAASAYQWSNGATSQAVSVSQAGKYTVRITDANGCQATADSVEIAMHDVKPVISHPNGLTVCYGEAITLSLAPHTGNIQWYKDNVALPGKTATTIDVAESGRYHAALDTLNCSFASPEAKVISNNTLTSLAKITPSRLSLCAGGDMTLTADEASKYEWSTGDVTQTVTIDAAGTYTLTVEDDFGCSSTATVAIAEVPVTIQPAITIVSGQTDLCPGSEVSLRVSEGTSFLWNNNATTQEITVTYDAAGTYSAQVFDVNGCSTTAEAVEITQVAEITPEIVSESAYICGNKPLVLSVIPEDDSYTCEWSNGETGPYIEITAGGNYTVTIVTVEGCRFTSVPVTFTNTAAPGKPVITSNFTITNDTVKVCPNQIAQITLTSSTANAYVWSNGETARSINAVDEGKYAVTVENQYGCTATSDSVVVSLKDNPVSIYTDSDETSLCPNGSITLNVAGADAGSLYEWYLNGSMVGASETFAATSSGTYSVKVTGPGGCIETTPDIQIDNFPTTIPVIIASGNLDICPYDSVLLTVTSGETYLWSTVDGQSIDDPSEQSIYVSKAGIYSVIVTDEFGCKQSVSAAVTVKPSHSPVITASKDIICQGDTLIFAAPADGVSFDWSNGETGRTITFDSPNRFGTMTYWVEVTYAEGCTYRTPDKSILVNKAPRQPEITVIGSNSICPDLTVALIATKSDDYRYQWRQETAPGVWTNYPDGQTFGIVADENSNYDVTITDKNGCSSRSEVLELNSLSSARVEIHPKGPIGLCEKDGWVQLEAFASEQNISYKWNTGETTKSIIVTQEGYYRVVVAALVEGQTCELQSSPVQIINGSLLPQPTITISGAVTFCEGGKVTLTSSIATNGLYEWIRWTATDTTKVGNYRTLEVTESGEYMVRFTDSKGCKVVSRLVKVTVNPIPEAVISPAGLFTVCTGERMNLSANEGAGYLYKWSAPSNATTRAINAMPGTYTVMVTTPQGCSKISDPVVIRSAAAQAPAPMVDNAGACPGEKATLMASSTITDPEFKWWDAAADGNLIGTGKTFETPELTDTYEVWVNVSSAMHCESPRRKATVTMGQKVAVDITTPDNIAICNFDKPFSLAATPAGGKFTGDGVVGSSFDPSLTGFGEHKIFYTVANLGCESSDSITVNVLPAPQISFGSAPASVCTNDPSFTINVDPGGGTLTGVGLEGSIFDPAVAGPGEYWIKYAISDTHCSRKDSIKIIVLQAPEPMIQNTQTVVGIASGAFELIGTPADGQFAGTGVVSSAGKAFFDPEVSGIGNHKVTYTVKNANGCEGTATITITVSPKPTVDKPAVPDAACEGDLLAVTVPAYDLHGSTLVGHGWLLNGIAFDPTTRKMTYADNGAVLQYKVTSGIGETVSESVTITVNAKPEVGTITAPAGICEGGVMTLPAVPTVTLRGSAVTGQGWLFNDAPFNPASANLTYADNGKMLQYYAASLCGTDTAAVAAVINAKPLIADIKTDQTVCAGGLLTITAPTVTERGVAATEAYWMFDGVRVDLSTRIFTDADNGKKLKYVVESSCGTAESNEGTVQTGAKSTAPGIIMNPLNGVICGTGTVTLSTATFAAYQWYKDGVPFSADASITVNQSQAGSYTVKGVNAGGCESEWSDPATVSIQAPLTLTIGGVKTVCESVIENYTIVGLVGNASDYTYEWTAPGGEIQGSATNASVNVRRTYGGAHTLDVKVTHKASKCETTASAVITVNAMPLLGTMVAPDAICENNKINPTAPSITERGLSVTGQGWLLNNQPFNPAATDLTYADNGKTLKYHVASACGNDTVAGVLITVNAAPAILDILDEYTVCAGGKLNPGLPIINNRGSNRTDEYWMFDGARVDLAARIFADADEGKTLKYVVESTCGKAESNTAVIHIGAKLPAPAITATPDNASICGTGSVMLETSGYAVYQWYRNSVDFAVTPSVTVNETQIGSFTVKGYAADGCESAVSDAVIVNVQTPPTPNIDGTTTVCEGAETTYKAIGLTGDADDYIYSWTIVGGVTETDAGKDTVAIMWNINGPHALTLTVTHIATGCSTNVALGTLTVNPEPVIDTADPDPVCPGGMIDLMTTVPANASVTYMFYESDMETPVSQPFTVAVPETGAIYYARSTDNVTGCQSRPKMITLGAKPLPVLTFNPANPKICNGTALPEITFSSSVPGTAYAWTNDQPGIGLAASGVTAFTPSFTAINTTSSPVTATVSVVATADGCTAPTQTFTVTVNPTPAFTPVVPSPFCTGIIDLTSMVPSGVSVTYTFYESDGETVVGEPNALVVNEGPGTYYVQSTDNATGCKSAMKPISFTAILAPTLTLVKDSITVCEGVPVNLTSAVPVNSAVTYTYFESDGATAVPAPAAIPAPAPGEKIYYVQSKHNVTTCPSEKLKIVVTVNEKPAVHIEAPNGTDICHNGTIELKAVTNADHDWIRWYDAKDNGSNTQFAPSTDVADVVYDPDPSEAGKTVKLYVRVHDKVCGYIADTIRIKVLPQPTAAVFELTAQPAAFQEMCVDTVYEVKVKASNLGDLHQIKIKLHDADGSHIAIKSASVKQPYASPAWAGLTESVSDITGTTWTLPGALAGGDSLQVQVTVAAECGFQSGLPVSFVFDAEDACGNALTRQTIAAAPFNTKQDVSQLNTYTVTGNFSIDNLNVTKVTNETGDEVLWRLTAEVHGIQATDTDKESMQILIPDGLTVIPDSYTPIENAPDRSQMKVSQDAFGTKFIMPLPPGLTDGNKIVAELKFRTGGAPCTTYDFYAEVVFSDSVECRGNKCTFKSTRGGVYPKLEVERYRFSLGGNVYGKTVDNLWYGNIPVKAETQFFAGDNIYIDFYVDRDNNSAITPTDTLVHSFTHTTAAVPAQGIFTVEFDSVYIEPQKQLLALVRGDVLCNTAVIPVATLMGADTVCREETSYYHTVPGMQNYKWNVIKPDGVSGATPVRIPLEGSTEANFVNENVARIVWKKQGDYTVWAQYSLPTDPPHEIGRTNFPVHVNERPEVALTGQADTTVCEGSQIELSHFFKETTGTGKLSFYRENPDGSLALLPGQKPVYVMPMEGTLYKAIAVSASGCESDAVDFFVNVGSMPQIGSVSVAAQPDCNTNTGSIKLAVTNGSGSYRYSIDGGTTYTDLPADGIIGNLPAGVYSVLVKDKAQTGCVPSVGDPVSLNPANSNLRATAQATNAATCSSSDGSIKVEVTGGTAPYQYSVNGGSYTDLPAGGVIGSGFAAGTYSITVQDADACTATAGNVQVKATGRPDIALAQLTPAACNTGGTASITLTGGTPGYSYRLSGQGWISMPSVPAVVNLSAGLHRIYAKDANGCETSDTVRIENTAGISVYLTGITNASCNDINSGSIRIRLNGTAPLTYSLDGGATQEPVDPGVTTIPNLAAGTYHILFTDSNGCTYVIEGIRIGKDALVETGPIYRLPNEP